MIDNELGLRGYDRDVAEPGERCSVALTMKVQGERR